jgi:nicotinamidase/pyrazinamidase
LDFCLKSTAIDLLDEGFKVIVNKAGTRGISPEGCAKAIKELTDLGAIIINSSDDLVLV